VTDDELIHLLEETPSEEWTPEQLELIASRLAKSPQLRAAMSDHLLLEQTLHHALDRVRFSVDDILARTVTDSEPSSVSKRGTVIAALLAFLLVCGGVAYWTVRNRPPHEVAEHLAPPAQVDPTEKTNDPSETPSPAVSSAPPSTMPAATPAAEVTTPPVAKPAVVAPPRVAQANEPWSAMLAEPPRSAEQIALMVPALEEGAVDLALLEKWWQPIRGKQSIVRERRLQGVSLEAGLFRLRAPWPSDTVLRLAFQSRPSVRFHIWSGRQGVMFEYYDRNGANWSSYVTERKQTSDLLPSLVTMVQTDSERYRRVGNGLIDFRYQDGRVWLSCGDIALASAPLANPPEVVALESEKRCVIGPIALVRTQPAVIPPPPVETPVELPLREVVSIKTLADDAKLVDRNDGGIELRGNELKQPALVGWQLTDPGLNMVDIQLDEVSPGSGVFLADEQGRPQMAINFCRDKKTQQMYLAHGGYGERGWDNAHDLNRSAIPTIATGQWLRILFGPRAVRVFLSLDGDRWGEALPPRIHSSKAACSMGIYLHAGRAPRVVGIRKVRTVALDEVAKLCPPELRGRMPDFKAVESAADWTMKVLATQPPEVDAARWRWACASHSIAVASHPIVAVFAVESLLDAPRLTKLPEIDSFKLLDQLAWLIDPSDYRSITLLNQAYEELALSNWRQGGEPPYSRIRRTLMTMPNAAHTSLDPLASPLLRTELLEFVHRGEWDKIHQLSRIVGFFAADFPEPRKIAGRDNNVRLTTWAEALAQRNRPIADRAAIATAIPSSWRHPLVEQLGKEGYNVLAELESALASGAFKDACQIISSMTAEQAIGLLPNARDPELLVSLPNAVTLAMRERPELAETMQKEFGALAELRLRQATVEADSQAMLALTTQFHSTTAAADAFIWLGDLALSTGDLRRAEAFYRRSIPRASTTSQPALAARLRLVAAMNGRQEGDAPTTAVRLGDVDLAPTALERLVEQSLRSAETESTDTASQSEPAETLATLPTPAAFTAKKLAKLEPVGGRDPGSFPRRDVDLLGAQTAVTVVSLHAFINTRFAVSCFDLADGKQVWQRPMDADQGRSFSWPMIAMRPVVAGPMVLARRLAGWGPELACLDRTTGALHWRSPRNEIVASDPLVLSGRIAAVTLAQAQQDVLQLSLTSYDPRTGKVLSQQPIVQLRDVWSRELPLVAEVIGDTVLIVGGGCVIGCNLEGNPRWLRRQTWLWGVTDHRTTPVRLDMPVIDGDRAIVTQPGVPSLSSIDIRSGQLHWQRVLPDNTKNLRLLGKGGEIVVAQTGEQLVAFALKDGEPRWQRTIAGLLEAAAVDARGNVLTTIGEKTSSKSTSVKLAWIDGVDGSFTDATYLRSWSGEQPWFGPLVASGERLYAVAGGEPSSAPTSRELIELTVSPAAAHDRMPDVASGPIVTTRVPTLPQRAFAGWTLLQSTASDDLLPGWRAKAIADQRDGFQSGASQSRPIVWARHFNAEDVATPQRLKLKFETPTSPTWKLEVRSGEKVIHSFPAASQPASPAYSTEVALPQEVGWVFVVLHQTGGGVGKILWEELQVVAGK